MDTTLQVLLALVILALGATLVVVGVQLFLLLRELRESVKKTNLILESVEKVSLALAEGSGKIKEGLGGVLSLFVVAKTLVEKFKAKEAK